MKTMNKVLLTSLGFVVTGAVLICITSTVPAGVVCLCVGSLGLMMAPVIAGVIEDSK